MKIATLPPEKSQPPLSQQLPLKLEVLSSPPFLKIWLEAMDHHNRIYDRQKASLNCHHDRQYLHVTTTVTNFNSFASFSKTILDIF